MANRPAPKGAQKEIVEIVINPDGTTENETSGFTGTACSTEINALFKAVGKPKTTQAKHEMYKKDKRVEVVRQ
jgi:hypothetical protein